MLLKYKDHIHKIHDIDLTKIDQTTQLYGQMREDFLFIPNDKYLETKEIEMKSEGLRKQLDDKFGNKGRDKLKELEDKLEYNQYPATVKNYLFGRYTSIFPQNQAHSTGILPGSNYAIAEKMDPIINNLKTGKPVFMIGYGASGAGKTSTLIYFNKGEDEKSRNGVLIELCKRMATDGYKKINLSLKEYYVTGNENEIYTKDNFQGEHESELRVIDNNDGKNVTVCKTHPELPFTYDDTKRNFMLKDDYYNIFHKYRYPEMERNRETGHGCYKPERDNCPSGFFEEGKRNLGEVIVNLVDQDRLVKATTNNPQSSRSHTVVNIELIKDDDEKPGEKNAYLFVGDFAGVENDFLCEDVRTVKQFLTVKADYNDAVVEIKAGDASAKVGIPYYSYNYSGGAPLPNLEDLDPVYGPSGSDDAQQAHRAQYYYLPKKEKNAVHLLKFVDFDKLGGEIEKQDEYKKTLDGNSFIDKFTEYIKGRLTEKSSSPRNPGISYDKIKNIIILILKGDLNSDGLLDELNNDEIYEKIWELIQSSLKLEQDEYEVDRYYTINKKLQSVKTALDSTNRNQQKANIIEDFKKNNSIFDDDEVENMCKPEEWKELLNGGWIKGEKGFSGDGSLNFMIPSPEKLYNLGTKGYHSLPKTWTGRKTYGRDPNYSWKVNNLKYDDSQEAEYFLNSELGPPNPDGLAIYNWFNTWADDESKEHRTIYDFNPGKPEPEFIYQGDKIVEIIANVAIGKGLGKTSGRYLKALETIPLDSPETLNELKRAWGFIFKQKDNVEKKVYDHFNNIIRKWGGTDSEKKKELIELYGPKGTIIGLKNNGRPQYDNEPIFKADTKWAKMSPEDRMFIYDESSYVGALGAGIPNTFNTSLNVNPKASVLRKGFIPTTGLFSANDIENKSIKLLPLDNIENGFSEYPKYGVDPRPELKILSDEEAQGGGAGRGQKRKTIRKPPPPNFQNLRISRLLLDYLRNPINSNEPKELDKMKDYFEASKGILLRHLNTMLMKNGYYINRESIKTPESIHDLKPISMMSGKVVGDVENTINATVLTNNTIDNTIVAIFLDFSVLKNKDNYNQMIEKHQEYLEEKGIELRKVHLYIHNMFRLLYFGNDFRVKNLEIDKTESVIKLFIKEYTKQDIWYIVKKESSEMGPLLKNIFLKNEAEQNITDPSYVDKTERESFYYTYEICEKLLEEIEKKLIYGKKICKNRLIEGKFINSSLRSMRDTMKTILNVKNSDAMFTIPDNSHLCKSFYKKVCGDSCYNIGSVNIDFDEETAKKRDSIMMFDIFEYLKSKKGGYGLENFYKEILVTVFCVLNMTPTKNNPPPSPYINLNDLIIAYHKFNSLNKTTVITNFRGKNAAERKERAENKVTNAKNELNEEIKKIIDKIEYYRTQNNDFAIYDVKIDESLLNNMKEMATDDDGSASKTKDPTSDGGETIKEFIESIDNTNAVSTMGTLEFVDKISKFYTTDIICTVEDDVFNNEKNFFEYSDIIKNKITANHLGETNDDDWDDDWDDGGDDL
jgi:hypothetical protein